MLRFLWAYLVYTWGGLHRLFGNRNSMRSEHEAAVRYFTKASEIDPTFHRVRLERGILLFRELGRFDEALSDFNFLLAEESDYSNLALLNRAIIHQQNARFDDALSDLNAFLELPADDYYNEAIRMRDVLQTMLSDDG
jgi:tetratricopeptide (TPR) repeat protein